jgi:CheY-like chemotaxis protein
MLGHTELLFPRLVDDGKGLASLREIRNAGRRAAQLTQQLMAFGRVRPLHPRAIDVASELSALVPVLSRLLGEDVVFPRPDLGGLPPVWMDPVQFGQILVGLALNAREAMPRGGEIRLEGVHHPMEDRVELLVMDTGAGIPPDILARLGEPFTTSKPRTPFAGLGLARIRSVVEQSSGKMSVESTVGKGTTVRLYFPVRRGAAQPSSVSGEGSMASASIVLVEDDEMVREFIGLCLEGWGHQVRSFGHPAEALRGIETKNFKADLLLTDVVLPGFSGVELSARARAGGAEFKVLYMSGYPEAEESGGPLARLPEPLLQKPFSTGQLRTALQAVLSPTP